MKMTVKDLIETLKQLDENAIIEVAGGICEYGTTDVEVAQIGKYVVIQEAP
jgi:hypothetical protein